MTKKSLTKVGFFIVTFLISAILIAIYITVSAKMKNMGLKISVPEVIAFTIKNKDFLLGKEQEPNISDDDGIIEKKKEIPQLQKDSTEKFTNFLIVGFDTRGETSGLKNTDSLIVANYNHETNEIILFSIPRDLYGIITIPDSKSTYYNKINSAYVYGEGRQKGLGLKTLELTVEKTLDIEIQYVASVNYEAFKSIIDLLGGIEVDVENSFTDYKYPGPTSYITVKFEKGLQTMNGETALQYARSRKSMQNGEGSDFARARRQQKVVEAVKNKLAETDMFTNPASIVSLLDTLSKNIQLSDYTVTDLEAVIALKDKIETAPIYNIVLDPSIGNFSILTTGVGTGYTIGPKKGIKNYSDLHLFVDKTMQYPALYSSPIKIFTYDTGLGAEESKAQTNNLKSELPFIDVRYWGLLKDFPTTGIIVFKNNEAVNDKSLSYIQSFFTSSTTTRPENLPALKNEELSVLFGTKPVVEAEGSESTENLETID